MQRQAQIFTKSHRRKDLVVSRFNLDRLAPLTNAPPNSSVLFGVPRIRWVHEVPPLSPSPPDFSYLFCCGHQDMDTNDR